MFNDPVGRAALGIIGVGLLTAYLGSYMFLWFFTYGLLFLLGAALVSTLGPRAVDVVALFAMWHLLSTLYGQFKAFRNRSL